MVVLSLVASIRQYQRASQIVFEDQPCRISSDEERACFERLQAKGPRELQGTEVLGRRGIINW